MCTVRVIPPRLLSLLSKHEDDSFSLDKEDWLCLKYWLTLFTWCHSYDDRTPFRIELKMPFQCFNLNLTFHNLLTFKLFQVCMSFLLLKTIRIYFEKCRYSRQQLMTTLTSKNIQKSMGAVNNFQNILFYLCNKVNYSSCHSTFTSREYVASLVQTH